MPSKYGGIPVEEQASAGGSKYGGVPVGDDAPPQPSGPARPTISSPMTNFPMQANGERSQTPQTIRAGAPPQPGIGETLMHAAIPLDSIMKLGRGIGNRDQPWQDTASDLLEGGAGVALPFAGPGLLRKPISSAVGAGLGFGAQKLAEGASSLFGGSPATNRLVGDVGGIAGGAGLSRGLGELSERGAPGVYQSALKPMRSKVKNLSGLNDVVKTGLSEGLPVSEGGVTGTKNEVENLNQRVTDAISSRGNAGLIDPNRVAGRIATLPDQFNSVTPESARTDIASAKGEYLAKHSAPAPFQPVKRALNPFTGQHSYRPEGDVVQNQRTVDYSPLEAQSEKQATYKELKNNYGQRSGAYEEAQKGLAHGLRGEISSAVPEVEPLNAREGRLINWLNVAEPRVMTAGNREGFTFNPYHTAARALESPNLKSRFAIGMDRFGRPLAQGSGTAGAGIIPLALRKKD